MFILSQKEEGGKERFSEDSLFYHCISRREETKPKTCREQEGK